MKYSIDYKYFILHKLYEKLYGFVVLDKKNKKKWIVYEDIEEGAYTVELKNTKNLDIDLKILLHYIAYKRLQKEFSDIKIMNNGRVSLFGENYERTV